TTGSSTTGSLYGPTSIVCAPGPGIANVIVSNPGLAFAAVIASRNVPGPESAALVTANTVSVAVDADPLVNAPHASAANAVGTHRKRTTSPPLSKRLARSPQHSPSSTYTSRRYDPTTEYACRPLLVLTYTIPLATSVEARLLAGPASRT